MIKITRGCMKPKVIARISELVDGARLKNKNGIIKWHVANWTDDIEKVEQVLIFKDVFRHYEFENYPLRYDSTSNFAGADIKIFFVASDGYAYLGEGIKVKCPEELEDTTLAFAYAPYGGKWEGHVFVNDKLFWGIKDQEGGTHVLYDTLIHELGHTHNLDHSDDEKDIMFWQERDGQSWGNDSLQGLFNIYAKDRLEAVENNKSAKLFCEAYKTGGKLVPKNKTKLKGITLKRVKDAAKKYLSDYWLDIQITLVLVILILAIVKGSK